MYRLKSIFCWFPICLRSQYKRSLQYGSSIEDAELMKTNHAIRLKQILIIMMILFPVYWSFLDPGMKLHPFYHSNHHGILKNVSCIPLLYRLGLSSFWPQQKSPLEITTLFLSSHLIWTIQPDFISILHLYSPLTSVLKGIFGSSTNQYRESWPYWWGDVLSACDLMLRNSVTEWIPILWSVIQIFW